MCPRDRSFWYDLPGTDLIVYVVHASLRTWSDWDNVHIIPVTDDHPSVAEPVDGASDPWSKSACTCGIFRSSLTTMHLEAHWWPSSVTTCQVLTSSRTWSTPTSARTHTHIHTHRHTHTYTHTHTRTQTHTHAHILQTPVVGHSFSWWSALYVCGHIINGHASIALRRTSWRGASLIVAAHHTHTHTRTHTHTHTPHPQTQLIHKQLTHTYSFTLFVHTHIVNNLFVHTHFVHTHFVNTHFVNTHFVNKHFVNKHFVHTHFINKHFVNKHFVNKHFAWQAWDRWHWVARVVRLHTNLTYNHFTYTNSCRRGTMSHLPSFCVAGVGQMVLGGALGPDLSPCVCFSCACLHRCRGAVVDKPRGKPGGTRRRRVRHVVRPSVQHTPLVSFNRGA